METQNVRGDLPEEAAPVSMKPSHFSALKARRARIGSEKTTLIDIPGYGGALVARYNLLEWNEVRQILKKMEKAKGQGDIRELWAMADTIIRSTDELLFRPEQGADPVPLVEGQKVRYDKMLAENMDISENASARQICLAIFRNDIALAAHHAQLVEWFQDNTADADEEFAGESSGPQSSGARP